MPTCIFHIFCRSKITETNSCQNKSEQELSYRQQIARMLRTIRWGHL